MYQYFILSVLLTAAYAKPGNLAFGTDYGVSLRSTGYGGGYGLAVGQGILGTNSPTLTTPVESPSPVVPAFLATASHAVPIATSSQSRLDIISPQPLLQQVVRSVPVTVPAGYLRYSIAGYGSGTGQARDVATGYGITHGSRVY